jgi:8-oxo-dGTP diphosphatase
MHKYTLGFIIRKDEVLMMNRQKTPWMGAWNGIGGKIEDGENPVDCLIREIKEETNIDVDPKEIYDKGEVTWNTFDANGHGLYLFLIKKDDDFNYQTPKVTDDGIICWKKIDWVSSFDNYGVAHNIPYFLPNLISNLSRYRYHCTFENRYLIHVEIERMD